MGTTRAASINAIKLETQVKMLGADDNSVQVYRERLDKLRDILDIDNFEKEL